MKIKGIWLAASAMWISTAIAVSIAIYITHSPWCLWAFIFPASMKFSSKNEEDGEK